MIIIWQGAVNYVILSPSSNHFGTFFFWKIFFLAFLIKRGHIWLFSQNNVISDSLNQLPESSLFHLLFLIIYFSTITTNDKREKTNSKFCLRNNREFFPCIFWLNTFQGSLLLTKISNSIKQRYDWLHIQVKSKLYMNYLKYILVCLDLLIQ